MAWSQPTEAVDWRRAEASFLTRHVQLTFPDKFVKAGEQYFDHQSPPRWVVFQAIERPAEGQEPDANYSMYVAKLKRDGDGHVTGVEEPVRASPPGSANTCGWFHPMRADALIFGSTLAPPVPGDAPGYSRDKKRYSWQFPPEMEVVGTSVGALLSLGRGRESTHHLDIHDEPQNDKGTVSQASIVNVLIASESEQPATWNPPAQSDGVMSRDEVRALVAEMMNDGSLWVAKHFGPTPGPLFERAGYDAECSLSKDGRFLLYTHVDPSDNDPNIWIFDTQTQKHYPIISAKGYDGGPFFSPDGKWICYRSDRKGNNVLQLYIAQLLYGDSADPAVPTGVKQEIQLTSEIAGKQDAEQAVSWCPFWHPSGKYLVYATSEIGHQNYEVFAIEVDPSKPREQLRKTRITHADGFDGLPAFSDDGKLLMWTSQRGPKREGEERPSSQMWIAEVVGEPAWPAK